MKKILFLLSMALCFFCNAQRTVGDNTQVLYSEIPSALPGGRLTLTSGTPITTSDVTGATTIYYTPYIHNRITLWNGSNWQTLTFTETSLALGTVTSGKPYDVFAYISGGALALEKLVWTNDNTRATAVTLQDGRYCKSGDKTRLLLGTFYTTSTTATEDSQLKRLLINQYNKVQRILFSDPGYNANSASTTYTYNTASWGAANGGTGATVNYLSNGTDAVVMSIKYTATLGSTSAIFQAGIGDNTTSSATGYFIAQAGQSGQFIGGECKRVLTPAAGYRSISIVMFSSGGITATVYADSDDNSYLTYVEGLIWG